MDQIQDKNSKYLYRLKNTVGLPTFVKEASIIDEDEKNQVPRKMFADYINKKFPIDTPANTWLSYAFYNKYASEDEISDTINEKINSAISFWNIQDSIDKLNSKDTELIQKNAKEKTKVKVAFSYKGKVHSTMELDSFEGLQKTALDFLKNRNKYPFEMRQSVSKQLLDAQNVFKGAFTKSVGSNLEKTACLGVTTKSDAVSFLFEKLHEHGVYSGLMPKFKEAAGLIATDNNTKYASPKILEKVAGMVDSIDRLSGLTSNMGYTPVEDSLFKVTYSQLQRTKKNSIDVGDLTFTKQAIAEKKDTIKRICKDAFNIKNVSLKDALKSLSNKQAHELKQILDFNKE